MDKIAVSLDELKRRRFASLVSSKHAVRKHPDEYKELRKLVQSVISRPIDASTYHPMADRLSRLLRKMTNAGSESVFSYFYHDIDPEQGGEIRYFRSTCCDLYEQMHRVDSFQIGERKIRRIK